MLNENYNKENTLVFFSGDAYSPSILTVFFKGYHMNEILNNCILDAAVLGNH
jgi:2',3'-cyclic-nucleotide 2'-phosphodiesterase (5'-nucleotidase family)